MSADINIKKPIVYSFKNFLKDMNPCSKTATQNKTIFVAKVIFAGLLGAISGGVIGFCVGGPAGAVIGVIFGGIAAAGSVICIEAKRLDKFEDEDALESSRKQYFTLQPAYSQSSES